LPTQVPDWCSLYRRKSQVPDDLFLERLHRDPPFVSDRISDYPSTLKCILIRLRQASKWMPISQKNLRPILRSAIRQPLDERPVATNQFANNRRRTNPKACDRYWAGHGQVSGHHPYKQTLKRTINGGAES
jgi:hypothetical protein